MTQALDGGLCIFYLTQTLQESFELDITIILILQMCKLNLREDRQLVKTYKQQNPNLHPDVSHYKNYPFH